MRILHILDHSLPLQSGYVYRTLGIVNEQRALGWEPVLLTSGKHYAPGPGRERIGEWEFLRTPMPKGPAARLPWLRELRIVSDLRWRLDEVIGELRPEILHAHSPVLNILPAIRAGRQHRIPTVYEVRALWEDAAASHGTHGKASLRCRLTRRIETYALHHADAVTTICEGLRADAIGRGVAGDKITVIPTPSIAILSKGRAFLTGRSKLGSLSAGKSSSASSGRSTLTKGWICFCTPFHICGGSVRISPSCLSAAAQKKATYRRLRKSSISAVAWSLQDAYRTSRYSVTTIWWISSSFHECRRA